MVGGGAQVDKRGHPYLERDTTQKMMTRHAHDTHAHTHSPWKPGSFLEGGMRHAGQ